MSESPKKHSKRSKLRRTAVSVLSHAYNVAADIAEERIDSESKTGVAAGTAATLLSLGIDKISGSQKDENPTARASILDIELDAYDSDTTMDDISLEVGSATPQDHFIDKLLEKLLVHAIPRKEREDLSLKLHDPERSKKPNLSIRIMVKNFRKLSSRLDIVFVAQYGVANVVSWRRPTVTLTFLVLYTSVCMHPHLILVYPILCVMYMVMAPSYMYRHPLGRPEVRRTKKRGKSVFDFLVGSEHLTRPARNLIPGWNATRASHLVPSAEPSLFPEEFEEALLDIVDDDESAQGAKSLKTQMELLINMRDLQNLTTELIYACDAVERFWFGTGGFSDERVSTSVFLSLLAMVVCILLFGLYIPWQLIFVLSGWGIIVSCHPKSAKVLKKLNKTYVKPQQEKTLKTIQKSEIKDIILDEPPAVNEVEVYELEEQGWTPSQWNGYCFTSTSFDGKERLKQQLPQGCSMLSEVLPPKSWKFDDDTPWKVDCDAEWAKDMEEVKLDDEGWVYDVENGGIGRWRRRRWVRNCYRYLRPAKTRRD